MRISKDTKLNEIQERFESLFPSLKLVFYRTPISADEVLKDENILDLTLTVGDIKNLPYGGFFPIHEEINVVDFEKMLSILFGLNAKIISRSGKSSLENVPREIYTLKEQNDLCFEVDNFLKQVISNS